MERCELKRSAIPRFLRVRVFVFVWGGGRSGISTSTTQPLSMSGLNSSDDRKTRHHIPNKARHRIHFDAGAGIPDRPIKAAAFHLWRGATLLLAGQSRTSFLFPPGPSRGSEKLIASLKRAPFLDEMSQLTSQKMPIQLPILKIPKIRGSSAQLKPTEASTPRNVGWVVSPDQIPKRSH